MLDFAVKATAQQVDDYCRRRRNVLKDESLADARRLHRERYLSRSVHGDGSMTISVELPQESGELVMKALEMEMALASLEADGGWRMADGGWRGKYRDRGDFPPAASGCPGGGGEGLFERRRRQG